MLHVKEIQVDSNKLSIITYLKQDAQKNILSIKAELQTIIFYVRQVTKKRFASPEQRAKINENALFSV